VLSEGASGRHSPRWPSPSIHPDGTRCGHPRASERKRIVKPELFWIPGTWRGRLAIAARPRGGDWLSDEVKGWRQAGADVVVSLLEEGEADQLNLLGERDAVESNAMSFLSYPIADRGTPASTREALSLIRQIVDQLDAGKNVILHCRQGIGRSGLIAAGVFVTSGAGSNEALRAVSDARGINVPETIEQRRWVEKLGSRMAFTKP